MSITNFLNPEDVNINSGTDLAEEELDEVLDAAIAEYLLPQEGGRSEDEDDAFVK